MNNYNNSSFLFIELYYYPQCGDEIDVAGIKFSQDVDNNSVDKKESMERSMAKEKVAACIISSPEKEDISNSHILDDVTAEKDRKAEEMSMQRSFNCETHPSGLRINQESENYDSEEFTNHESNYDNNIQQVDVNLENLEVEIAGRSENILHLHKHNRDAEDKIVNVEICNDNKASQSRLDEISNRNEISERLQLQSVEASDNKNKNEMRLQPRLDEINNSSNDEKIIQSELDKMRSGNNSVISSASTCGEYSEIGKTNKINKNKKPKETDNAEVQSNIYHKLTTHIEQNVREWITKNTLCLLTGEADEKNQLLEKLTQYDRYQQLCKKLNKLQMEDKKEDHVDLEKNELKSLPHFSVLQEDGKKMELKVRQNINLNLIKNWM